MISNWTKKNVVYQKKTRTRIPRKKTDKHELCGLNGLCGLNELCGYV